MIKETVKNVFPSTDGNAQISYKIYIPTDNPKAVIQICHGMWEHIGVYERNGLIKTLTDAGMVVCGNDHIGHGSTAPDDALLGHFDNCKYMVDDINELNAIVRKRYPYLPYILLGHGFGSFLVRDYITRYQNIDGAVIMGSTSADKPLGTLKALSSLTALFRGKRHRTQLVKKLTVGALNMRFASEKDEYSFRNSIPDERTKIRYDGNQVFDYTVSAYKAVISLADSVCSSEWAAKVPLSLPVYLMSGKNDPVSEGGESVKQLFTALEDVELNELKMDFFDGRHDVMSDIGRAEAVRSLIDWTESVCEGVVACRSFNSIPFGKVDF